MTNDIRKFLNLLESPVDEGNLLIECMDGQSSQWYNTASNIMIQRIKAGEYPVDVINELAREYSWTKNGDYEAFAFARDALDRRAWEMGLRYTDDSTNDDRIEQGYHAALLSPRVTEDSDVEDEELDEMIYEASLMDRILARISPDGRAANQLKSDKEFKILTKTLVKNFDNTFGFGDKRNLTFDNAVKSLQLVDISPSVIKKVKQEFLQKFPNVDTSNVNGSQLKALFVITAAEIMTMGGMQNATTANKGGGEKSDKPKKAKKKKTAAADSPTGDSTEQPAPAPTSEPAPAPRPNTKFKQIKRIEDIERLTQKAINGQEQLNADELHDLAVALQRYGIPALKDKARK